MNTADFPRPLPAITLENEFFWTSGRDGVLRVQRSVRCGALLLPPTPVCPYCHSTDIEIVDLSGRATVVGFTVNAHAWLPSFPPPYVIAIVAFDEDNRVRLTTNIVECDPNDVYVGMRVEVVFEHHDDVWLPLFRPTGDDEPGELPGEDDEVPSSPDGVEGEVREQGRHLGHRHVAHRSSFDGRPVVPHRGCLHAGNQRCRSVAGRHRRVGDLSGRVRHSRLLRGRHRRRGERVLRVRPTWISGGSETPGQTGSIVNAMLAVAAGLCRHVLCFRTVWESTAAALARQTISTNQPRQRIEGSLQWRIPFGAPSAANWIGMNASVHMHRYGTTRETLGWVALNARRNAALNPNAIYREELTMDDYMNARSVSTPFGLYDCDVPCDGAVAVIISAVDAAPDLARPLIAVEAVGTQITEPVSWEQGTLEHEVLLAGPSAHLWSRTDLRHADVDVALLYDGFTFNCLSWIESLGFCGIGEAKDFLHGGTNISLTGQLPLNPHGGQLSAGRTHGYGYVHEAVLQLRGDAGARQIENAEVALVSTGGGSPGGCMLLTR